MYKSFGLFLWVSEIEGGYEYFESYLIWRLDQLEVTSFQQDIMQVLILTVCLLMHKVRNKEITFQPAFNTSDNFPPYNTG